MNVTSKRNAAIVGTLVLLCSLGFGDWTQLNSGVIGELFSVHFPMGTTVGYAVGVGPDSLGGLSGIIIKTTDGGATWIPQSTGAPVGALNSVYFIDDNNGYAVGERGAALRTADGGTTWTPMTVPVTNTLNLVQFPQKGQTGYIGYRPDAGAKLLKTVDGGTSWTEKPVGGPMSVSSSCGFANDNVGVIVGPGGAVYGSVTGFDSSWAQGPQTIADMVGAAFDPTDANRGYLIGNDSTQGVIRFTATFGSPLWDSVRCWTVPAFYGINMPTTDVAYVCGSEGMILRSVANTDFYRTTVPNGFNLPVYGLSFPNGADTGYAVGASGTILKTTNGGIPLIPGVAEGKTPAVARNEIRVASNPCRRGIPLQADADIRVFVFDATGRVVRSQAVDQGLNFLALPTGAYFVKAGASTARAVVTD